MNRKLPRRNIALFQPPHASFVNLLRTDEPVQLPRIIADQMPGQHFVPSAFEQLNDSPCDINGGPVTSDYEAEVDVHTL